MLKVGSNDNRDKEDNFPCVLESSFGLNDDTEPKTDSPDAKTSSQKMNSDTILSGVHTARFPAFIVMLAA